MTGLEKIINKIKADSAAESEAILADARSRAEKIAADAEKEASGLAERTLSEARAKSENIVAAARSGAERLEKRAVLEAKVEVIDETLARFLDALTALPEKDYFDALLKLARENAMSGECVVRLNAADIKRLPADFEKRLCEELESKGASCSVSREPADMRGGLVMVYGDVEVNCSFDAVVEAETDELKALIDEIIF